MKDNFLIAYWLLLYQPGFAADMNTSNDVKQINYFSATLITEINSCFGPKKKLITSFVGQFWVYIMIVLGFYFLCFIKSASKSGFGQKGREGITFSSFRNGLSMEFSSFGLIMCVFFPCCLAGRFWCCVRSRDHSQTLSAGVRLGHEWRRNHLRLGSSAALLLLLPGYLPSGAGSSVLQWEKTAFRGSRKVKANDYIASFSNCSNMQIILGSGKW